MRSTSVRFSTVLLVAVLSTGALASPALAMDRGGSGRDPDNPVIRIIRLVKHLIRTFDEQISVPKP
jgi:hypothetical protein